MYLVPLGETTGSDLGKKEKTEIEKEEKEEKRSKEFE
tara:strand:+ start:356 stop:466 length:111 start_codon:yes stop_codon:yes gene_type:complete